MTENNERMPEGMGRAVYEQVLELWVEPEIERRGVDQDPASIRQALVIMPADGPIEVMINAEAEITADVVAARPIAAGELVTLDDIQRLHSLRPHDISPDAGWVLFAWVGLDLYVAFDFRRNRKKAQVLLARASSFAGVAETAAKSGSPAAALVNAYAAAELAIKANMLVHASDVKQTHTTRRNWIARWARLGNVPRDHSSTLGQLADHQKAARYGDKDLGVSEDVLLQLLAGVQDIIAVATAAVGGEATPRT